MKQSSMLTFFKKRRLDVDDQPVDRRPTTSTTAEEDASSSPSTSATSALLEVTEIMAAAAAPAETPLAAGARAHSPTAVPCSAETEPEDAVAEISNVADLSAVDEPACQPKLGTFPQSAASGKNRSFSAKWYNRYSWLEYSIKRDAVFCQACRHFNTDVKEDRFSKAGLRDWGHLGQFCNKHEASKNHAAAVARLKGFLDIKRAGKGDIVHQVTKDKQQHFAELVDRNRAHVKVMIDIALFCAKQGIALRGHREDAESMNKGNFLELFELISTYDPEIKRRLDELPGNAKMMSPDIQNDLLETAASLLIRKIKAELHTETDTYYAILADEYKDLSKKELIAVCVRYIHNGNLRERAVGFVATEDMTSSGITEHILEVLEPLQLDPELCVGFGFDGASVMSGEKGGVQMLLKKTFPHAVYVHCHSHRLNLVLSTASKASPTVATFFDILNSLHHFMTGANRHARFLNIQKELHPHRPCVELVRSTDIRWSSKSESVSRVLTLYDVILETLSEFAEGSGQTKIDAQSLLQQIQTKRFIFLLVAFSKLFSASDFATKGLQSPSVSVTDCIHMIEGLKETFNKLRNNSDGEFDQIIRLTDDVMKNNDVQNWDVAGARKRKLPSTLVDSYVTSTVGRSAPIIRSDLDLQSLWISILDRQLMELNNRFQGDSYGIMKAAATLLPASDSFGQMEILQAPSQHYGLAVEGPELTVFGQLIKRKVDGGHSYPSLIEVLDSCDKDVFPNMNSLLRVLITLPVTMIKSSNRASMVTGRLNSLSMLAFERELTETLESDEIIELFKTKPRRLAL